MPDAYNKDSYRNLAVLFTLLWEMNDSYANDKAWILEYSDLPNNILCAENFKDIKASRNHEA
jgi:hypothetical protein